MQAVEIVKEFEGFSPCSYICPGGKKTIGFGHAILPDEEFEEPLTISQAETILFEDLHTASAAVNDLVTALLTQAQFDALTSFVYNIGRGNFASSTMLKLLNQRDYEGASREFGRWIYGGGKRLPGLIRRREREKEVFISKS